MGLHDSLLDIDTAAEAFSNYDGRISKETFQQIVFGLVGLVIAIFVGTVSYFLDSILSSRSFLPLGSIIAITFGCVMFSPVLVKRGHDLKLSASTILTPLLLICGGGLVANSGSKIPDTLGFSAFGIGSIWSGLLWFSLLFTSGTKGTNKYGSDPREIS